MLVEHLVERAPGAPETGPWGRALPAPQTMAETGEGFYKYVARAGAGICGLYPVRSEGVLDLEALDAPPEELPEDELKRRLLAPTRVGAYSTAHIVMMLGCYSRLILDSWTRPTYAWLDGGSTLTDPEIQARFSGYGPYKGLAFWLHLTRSWVEEPEEMLLTASPRCDPQTSVAAVFDPRRSIRFAA